MTSLLDYEFGTVLFSVSATDEEAIEAARAYIRENGLTQNDVRIRKGENYISVVRK